jgi:hypothetical protein
MVEARKAEARKAETRKVEARKELSKTANDITKAAQDAAYVAIGLGVMGFQKAQVRRRELLSQLESRRATFETPINDFRKEIAKALKEIDKTFGQLFERVDATIEPVSERLPAGAQAVVHQAREARDHLRGYLTSLAA